MRSIVIVTGEIDSGKTSWCRDLAARTPGCGGLLLSKVYQGGRRIGYDALPLPAGRAVPFARRAGYEPADWRGAEQVGEFMISERGLRAANRWLIEAAARPLPLIVDEIGPLELDGGGLSEGLRAVLGSPHPQPCNLVIRSSCLQAVCRRFAIRSYDIVRVPA